MPVTKEFITKYQMGAPSEGDARKGPFLVEFESPLDDVSAFIEDVFDCRPPYYMWGINRRVDEEYTDDYWKVNAVALPRPTEEGLITSAEREKAGCITFEICPEWMRIYVRDAPAPDRIADFFDTLADEYDFSVEG